MSRLLGTSTRSISALAAGLAMALGGLATSAHADADIGLSLSINQPGLYGRVDIGNTSPPEVVNVAPVVIAPTPYAVHQRPIYLYVPPEHQHDWGHYCARYAACGQPVYFVKDRPAGWRGGREDLRHDRGDYHRHDREQLHRDEGHRDDMRRDDMRRDDMHRDDHGR